MSDSLKELVRAQDDIGKFETIFARKDGKVVGVNKRRLYETPFFLLTNPPNNDVSIPATNSSTIEMRVSNEGPIQITQLGALRDTLHSPMLVRLFMRDGSSVNMMMNAPCHIDTIFGPGGQMYPLVEGLFIDETRSMSAVFTNLTPSTPGYARIVGVGAKYSQLQQDPSLKRVKDRLKKKEFLSSPFFYTLDGGSKTLSALSSVVVPVQMNLDTNFELHQIGFSSTGDFNIDIVDAAKGESILCAPRGTHYPIPNKLMCGTTGYPFRFHEPIMCYAGQTLNITLIDTSAASNQIFLTLAGLAVKVRKWS